MPDVASERFQVRKPVFDELAAQVAGDVGGAEPTHVRQRLFAAVSERLDGGTITSAQLDEAAAEVAAELTAERGGRRFTDEEERAYAKFCSALGIEELDAAAEQDERQSVSAEEAEYTAFSTALGALA